MMWLLNEPDWALWQNISVSFVSSCHSLFSIISFIWLSALPYVMPAHGAGMSTLGCPDQVLTIDGGTVAQENTQPLTLQNSPPPQFPVSLTSPQQKNKQINKMNKVILLTPPYLASQESFVLSI